MIKVFPPRFEPDWLASVSEEHPLPLSDLLQNSLYYPASRLDGDPVRYFAGFLHSFVYADSSISKEAITEDLYRRGHGFTGYRVRFCKDVSNSIKAGGSTLADQAVKDTYALWVVLERLEKVDSSRGPSRFSFLFVGGEGVSVYDVYDTLYRSNNTAPEILAVVQRLSNPRGGGADLANHDEIFARTALTESGERPQYLLRVDRHGLHHWPEYTFEVSR